MILFVGQVGRDMREREAFQELDYRAVFGSIAKWVTEIDDPARIPELVSRAFYTATNGRPGPVVIALPEDMLEERASVADVPAFELIETSPGAAEIDRMRQLLAAAERPIVIAGGSRWSEAASAALMRFAERFDIPVATSFRRTHVMDPLHPSYAGDLASGPNPKLLARVKAADLVLLLGGRLGEWPSQSYSLLDVPVPKQTLIHVHPGIEELGRVYRPTLAIHSTPTAFAAALDQLAAPNDIAWHDETKTAHADYLAFSEKPTAVPGPVNMGEIVVGLRDVLPARRHCDHRRGKFLDLGAAVLPLSPVRHAVRAGLRLHGLRPAVGGRDETGASGAHGRRILRRRRLHDDGAGIRDRGAIRAAADRDRRRQRHVRHHPYASGAALPRAGDCDHAAQS